jgi:hypothetical protein
MRRDSPKAAPARSTIPGRPAEAMTRTTDRRVHVMAGRSLMTWIEYMSVSGLAARRKVAKRAPAAGSPSSRPKANMSRRAAPACARITQSAPCSDPARTEPRARSAGRPGV